MTTVLRNAAIGFLLPIGAILFVALLEGVMQNVAPEISDRPVGSTNLLTVIQGVAAAVLFFACGFVGPKWLKGPASVLWLLTPVAALYATAIIRSPYLYQWNPQSLGWTLFMHAPFLLPLIATLIGYAVFSLRSASARVF